jgi:hypothetical protein
VMTSLFSLKSVIVVAPAASCCATYALSISCRPHVVPSPNTICSSPL